VKLHRAERDNYILTIATVPALTGTWEASFDDGETWVEGQSDSGSWAWLVAGPDFVAADVGMTDDGTVLDHSTTPLVRVKDDPVLDIQRAPSIILWGEPAAEDA
jgi:hypothetical protein